MNALEIIQKSMLAQKQYCEEKGLPCFVGGNGRCHRCGKYVFDPDGGVSEEAAGKKLVTGCPFCHASFCE